MSRLVKPRPPRIWFVTKAACQSGSVRRIPGKAHRIMACGASLSVT